MTLPSWLEEKKNQAKERFEAAEAPILKYGLTIRLNTKGLELKGREDTDSEQIVSLEYENCEAYNLFDKLDGVKDYLLSTTPANKTQFDDFQEAFFDMGLLVIVPENTKATIDLTRTITSETFKEHILVICKKNSNLTFIDKYGSEVCEVRSAAIEIICEEGAKARYAAIQNLNENCFDLFSLRSNNQGNTSHVDWFVGTLGSKLTHANVDTYLNGEGASSNSYGVFLGNNNQQFDLSASTFHKGNHTQSDMYTRGVLDGKTKAVYRGNIDISADAFGCNGYQTEETILVGDNAVADAIPNLEIRNNDVKCSHGATIGRIDEEQLFYLKSRGIQKEEAVQMIIEGFFEPLTAKLEWPEVYDILLPLVKQKVSV